MKIITRGFGKNQSIITRGYEKHLLEQIYRVLKLSTSFCKNIVVDTVFSKSIKFTTICCSKTIKLAKGKLMSNMKLWTSFVDDKIKLNTSSDNKKILNKIIKFGKNILLWCRIDSGKDKE